MSLFELFDGMIVFAAGTVELLRSGALPADFWDWREGADFAFGHRRGAAAAAFATSDGEEEAEADDAEMGNGNGAGNGNAPLAKPGFGAVPIERAEAAAGGAAPATAVALPDSADGAAGSSATSLSAPAAVADAAARPDGAPATPHVIGVDVRSPFGPLASADGLRTEFTNYVRGYAGALDYVWCDLIILPLGETFTNSVRFKVLYRDSLLHRATHHSFMTRLTTRHFSTAPLTPRPLPPCRTGTSRGAWR